MKNNKRIEELQFEIGKLIISKHVMKKTYDAIQGGDVTHLTYVELAGLSRMLTVDDKLMKLSAELEALMISESLKPGKKSDAKKTSGRGL